jgi:hypothetical protein
MVMPAQPSQHAKVAKTAGSRQRITVKSRRKITVNLIRFDAIDIDTRSDLVDTVV